MKKMLVLLFLCIASSAPAADYAGTATGAELDYVHGVTSSIQTQLNNKQPLAANLTGINQSLATTGTPSFAAVTATGASGVSVGVAGSTLGLIKFYTNTPANNYTFSLFPGNLTADLGWRFPTSAPGGANYLLNVDADGTMDYTDPATLGGDDLGNATSADVVTLFNSGTCSGYLKSDGSCDTPTGAGDVVKVGTPANYQFGIWTGDGTLKGLAVTGSSAMCTNANGEPVACSNLTDAAIPAVSDVAYDATTWDANTDAPSKNSVRDYLESKLPSGADGTYGIVQNNNTTRTPTAASYEQYFEGGILKVNQNGTESSIPIGPTAGQITFTGPTQARSYALPDSSETLLYSGGAAGTPSSITLTNGTGLPVSGITASTSTALGVGSVELGHASDTTIARSGAGVATIEGVTITRTIASGTSALGTDAIASGACATAVTTTATGTATTDVIDWGFNADPTSTTGYSASANGMLTIIAYPTANNVNFKVCNNTAASITPGAVTLNWKVAR